MQIVVDVSVIMSYEEFAEFKKKIGFAHRETSINGPERMAEFNEFVCKKSSVPLKLPFRNSEKFVGVEINLESIDPKFFKFLDKPTDIARWSGRMRNIVKKIDGVRF